MYVWRNNGRIFSILKSIELLFKLENWGPDWKGWKCKCLDSLRRKCVQPTYSSWCGCFSWRTCGIFQKHHNSKLYNLCIIFSSKRVLFPLQWTAVECIALSLKLQAFDSMQSEYRLGRHSGHSLCHSLSLKLHFIKVFGL